MSTLDSTCWSGLNARRSVLQPSDTSRPLSRSSGKSSHGDSESLLLPDELDLIDALEDEQQQTFSPIGTSAGAQLYLIQTPRGAAAAPPTVIWATSRSEFAWGHWPYYAFSHCISVLTERDARAAYEIQSNSGDSDSEENESPSPLPPVYECLIDGVEHLWLIVPRRSARKVNGLMQLSEVQMRAAVAFYMRTTAAAAAADGSARGTNDAHVDNNVAADRDRNSQPEEGDDAGLDSDPGVAAPVLVSCTYGNEVDAIGIAVLLLAQHVKIRRHHHRRASGYRSARGSQSINSQAYRASRLIETDQGVSHIWKGLLEWQDVERVQTVLCSSVN